MISQKTVQLSKAKLAYLEQGEGTPLVLLHGITTYSFIWQELIEPLSKHYRVIAFDLLGCGASEMSESLDYSISAQANHIQEALDILGIELCHLICHDIGGGIGQIVSTRYQTKLLSLSLINSIGFDYWPVQPITGMRIPIIRHLGMAALDLGFFQLLIRRGLYHKEKLTPELMAQYYAPLTKKAGKNAFLQLAKSLDNRQLMAVTEELGKLEIPVLIVRGEADVYLKAEIDEHLHRHIPNSRYEVFPTAGHFAQVDEPEQLTQLLLEFVAGG